MTRLAILGPNLIDQSKGSFHVHNACCADLRKKGYRGASMYIEDFDSFEQVVTEMYSDIIAENGDDWTVYANDFHVCPCVNFVK